MILHVIASALMMMMPSPPLQLSLVDLAGSERAAKTGATPEQLKVRIFVFLICFISMEKTGDEIKKGLKSEGFSVKSQEIMNFEALQIALI